MITVDQIKEAIKNGVNHSSKLTDEQFKVGGFTSPNIRHVMNNLGGLAKSYFEVGSHIGCSLVMTVYGNGNIRSAIACDNFSEFQNDGRTKQQFLDNCEANIPGRYLLWEKNCFKLGSDDFNKIIPPDLYLIDGGHDYESQRDGVTHMHPFMADRYIMVVDDFAWDSPRRGTQDGIKETGATIVWDCFLYDGIESGSFWNGLGIFLIQK